MTRQIDYRYDECGLDNVILKGFPVYTDDTGDECIRIPHIKGLHRAITEAVAKKPTGLLPRELRFLRTELRLTQAELAETVGKDAQTIGRWERGETPIEGAAETVVRMLALQRVTHGKLPAIETVAQRAAVSSGEPPFLIDARNPKKYRALVPEAA